MNQKDSLSEWGTGIWLGGWGLGLGFVIGNWNWDFELGLKVGLESGLGLKLGYRLIILYLIDCGDAGLVRIKYGQLYPTSFLDYLT